jgi:AcrR family transcriptional regulator
VNRDEAILKAAAALFRERGFHAVGVDEIGARAGVTGPAIYRHFSGKDEILATLYDQAMDRLLLLTDEQHDDPFTALQALIDAQVRFALGGRALLSVYVREDRSLADPWRRRIRRRQRDHVDRWVRALARCYPDRPAEELTAAAHAAIGLALSVVHWPRDAFAAHDLVALLTDLVVGGLSTLEGAGRPVLRCASHTLAVNDG